MAAICGTWQKSRGNGSMWTSKKVLLAEFDKQLTVEKANLLRDMEAMVK